MKIPFFTKAYSALMKHPRYRWVVIGASLIYLISPIDFSPDLIPIVGWIDDGVVATLLATGITQLLLDRRRAVKTALDANSNAVDVATLPPDAENS